MPACSKSGEISLWTVFESTVTNAISLVTSMDQLDLVSAHAVSIKLQSAIIKSMSECAARAQQLAQETDLAENGASPRKRKFANNDSTVVGGGERDRMRKIVKMEFFSPDRRFEFIPSLCDAKILIMEGYTYHKMSLPDRNGVQSWECRAKKICKRKVRVKDELVLGEYGDPHTHKPLTEDFIAKLKANNQAFVEGRSHLNGQLVKQMKVPRYHWQKLDSEEMCPPLPRDPSNKVRILEYFGTDRRFDFLTTSRGGKLLFLDNNVFRKSVCYSDGAIVWRCKMKDCERKVVTTPGEEEEFRIEGDYGPPHNHSPLDDATLERVRQVPSVKRELPLHGARAHPRRRSGVRMSRDLSGRFSVRRNLKKTVGGAGDASSCLQQDYHSYYDDGEDPELQEYPEVPGLLYRLGIT